MIPCAVQVFPDRPRGLLMGPQALVCSLAWGFPSPSGIRNSSFAPLHPAHTPQTDRTTAYHATNDTIKRDEIAARQARLLSEHLGPREKKLRLIDVREMFVQMKDHV